MSPLEGLERNTRIEECGGVTGFQVPSRFMLQMTGISKRFAGVKALDSVQFSVAAGEVVALVGENGAGKSTLTRILAGVEQPDAGSIRLDGGTVSIRSPKESTALGIGVVHQELEVVDSLDVAGNIFLGREPTWAGPLKLVDGRQIHARARIELLRVGLDVRTDTLVGRLSTAERQLVEIARVLSQNARILIMDEPTSSLTSTEVDRLIDLVRELRSDRVGVVYISHRLEEIDRVADRVVVLRDGKNAGELAGPDIERDRVVRLMVGHDPETLHSLREVADRPVCMELEGVRTARYPGHEISLSIRSGEILGLSGLIGAGRSELARAIFGVEPARAGRFIMDGAAAPILSPRDAIRRGIYLVPEDRRRSGLVTTMSVRENVTLPNLRRLSSWGWVRRAHESDAARTACASFGVKTVSIETPASELSGGNQQKVVLARWLSLAPRLLLFDEPTRGIDVGAKAEIYRLMRDMADKGVAILMISSDMEEILANSDRVAVMREGRLTGILDRAHCTREAVMQLAVA